MAKLPVLVHPLFDVIIPSTKKVIKLRPMLVKEEKILLIAKESGTNKDIYQAIKQIVHNCLSGTNYPVDKLTLFDLEFIFLKLRAISVSNVVKVIYKDAEDKNDYPFEVKLDDLEVKFSDKYLEKIATAADAGFVCKYPTAEIYASPIFANAEAKEVDLVEELVIHSVESYFQGETIFKFSENKKEDIKAFIENLPISVYDKLKENVLELPKLHYEFKYKNALGNDRVITMSSLSDFFI